MIRNALGALVLGAVALGGCTTSSAGEEGAGGSVTAGSATQAQTLWADRTAYAGDNSKVIALVGAAGFAPEGRFSLSLWTTKPPYAVTIDVPEPAEPFEATDYTAPATLLLGTVRNLETVHVTSQGKTWTLTAEKASAALGHDVKQLGTDRAALERYVGSLRD